jgi:hypothetical protein
MVGPLSAAVGSTSAWQNSEQGQWIVRLTAEATRQAKQAAGAGTLLQFSGCVSSWGRRVCLANCSFEPMPEAVVCTC